MRARLRCIVACIGPNQKIQPNLDLYLVRRYIFSQLLVMLSVSKYLKDTKIQPFMYLYLYLRYISKVSVATLCEGMVYGMSRLTQVNSSQDLKGVSRLIYFCITLDNSGKISNLISLESKKI